MRDDPRSAEVRSPVPPRYIAAVVRGLKRAQARFSNSPLTLPPSAFRLPPSSFSGGSPPRRQAALASRAAGSATASFWSSGIGRWNR
jgi:hypothetical protein